MSSVVEARLRRFTGNLLADGELQTRLGQILILSSHQSSMAALIDAMNPGVEQGQTAQETDANPAMIDVLADSCPELLALNETHRLRFAEQLQCWISAGRSIASPPTAQKLKMPSAGTPYWGGKPGRSGLYTSTSCGGDPGMWFLYILDHDSEFPAPWYAWLLQIDPIAKILTIDSAADWCSFVEEFPSESATGLLPAWAKIGTVYDAVHITPKAVVAIDAIGFRKGQLSIAPSYWSTETTVWLRWKFTRVRPCKLPAESHY